MKVHRLLLGAAFAAVGFTCYINYPDNSAAAASTGFAGGTSVEVIASDLNNPRGLNFGPDGGLYVAEAGSGGDGPCGPGPEGTRCYGRSGGVIRIGTDGAVTRIISDLPSLGNEEDGGFATGPHDLSFNGLGNGYLTIGFGGNPANRTVDFGSVGEEFARAVRFNKKGKWQFDSDLGTFEGEEDPAGEGPDSNPYSMLVMPGRRVFTDAGGNALNQVSAKGEITNLAVFPNRLGAMPPGFPGPPVFPPAGTLINMDAVPTTVTQGPDGSFYIGQLTGFPFPVDDANVYRVPSDGGTPEIFAGGFTGIIDIAFGPDGSLYVLQIAKNGVLRGFVFGDWTGELTRVAPDGTRTEIAPGALTAPGGIAVGADGALYVTNKSVSSGIGEVVKITP
jgi:glucose/arabinose dehydrogenase